MLDRIIDNRPHENVVCCHSIFPSICQCISTSLCVMHHNHGLFVAWWRHQVATFSALLALCAGNSPVTGEFPTHRPVTWSFDVFFDLRLNKRFSTQPWWFETASPSLWRHCNVKSLVRLTTNESSKVHITGPFLRAIHWQVIWKAFLFHDVSMCCRGIARSPCCQSARKSPLKGVDR